MSRSWRLRHASGVRQPRSVASPKRYPAAALDHDSDRFPRIVRHREHVNPEAAAGKRNAGRHRTGEGAEDRATAALVRARACRRREPGAAWRNGRFPCSDRRARGSEAPRRRRRRNGPPPPACVRVPGTRIPHRAADSLRHSRRSCCCRRCRSRARQPADSRLRPLYGDATAASIRGRRRPAHRRRRARVAGSSSFRTAGRSRTSCGCRPTP